MSDARSGCVRKPPRSRWTSFVEAAHELLYGPSALDDGRDAE